MVLKALMAFPEAMVAFPKAVVAFPLPQGHGCLPQGHGGLDFLLIAQLSVRRSRNLYGTHPLPTSRFIMVRMIN